MLIIDRLRLTLPPGFENRASGIARQVGELLADGSAGAARSVEKLEVGPVRISAGMGDHQAAQAIARGIRGAIHGGGGNGGNGGHRK